LAFLQSISPINKVFQTNGSNPVKVLCEDLNEYVCKYSRGNPASGLFNEYLAASFLRVWNLSVPEFRVITIQAKHITPEYQSTTVQPRFFQSPCFGSKHYEYGKEIDPSIGVIDTKIVKQIRNKGDLLAIALFDLWMANEDRNHNNYNLLLDSREDGYAFMPIDHEKCFNTNSLTSQRGLVILTEDETLVNTELSKLVFRNFKELEALIDQIANDYYLWVAECQNGLENVINAMPDQWGIAKADKIAQLNAALFQNAWIDNCCETFKEYSSTFLLS